MKKIILLLLLAQTISFITADSGCMKYSWGLGEKMPEHTQCYCNCEQYVQVLTNRRKCNECGHYRVPKKMNVNKNHSEVLRQKESASENNMNTIHKGRQW